MIGLGVGILLLNLVVFYIKSCKCGKRLNFWFLICCFKDIFKFYYLIVLFN